MSMLCGRGFACRESSLVRKGPVRDRVERRRDRAVGPGWQGPGAAGLSVIGIQIAILRTFTKLENGGFPLLPSVRNYHLPRLLALLHNSRREHPYSRDAFGSSSTPTRAKVFASSPLMIPHLARWLKVSFLASVSPSSAAFEMVCFCPSGRLRNPDPASEYPRSQTRPPSESSRHPQDQFSGLCIFEVLA